MGNAQSTEFESPCPLCRTLCLRSGQSASKVDEGEWFDVLPREKSSRRRGTGKSQAKLGKQPSMPMPPVPEDAEYYSNAPPSPPVAALIA